MPAPRVFVSYSHDSDAHKVWVLKLATDLRRNGVDVILDQWDVDLGDDLPRFMESIVQTDRVLMICSDNYVNRCNEGERGGVPMERRLMSGQLMQGRSPRTFIPVLRANPQSRLPNFIGGGAYYIDFNDNDHYGEKYWELLASIHGARVQKPPIGPNPFEKGLDAAFGTNGLQILRGIDLRGFRLALENEFYFVTASNAGAAALAKIAKNGAFDESFGKEGLLRFPRLNLIDQYGLERHDILFFDGKIYKTSPTFDQPLQFCSVDEPEVLRTFEVGVPIAAIAPEDRPTALFIDPGVDFGIVFFRFRSTGPGYELVNIQRGSLVFDWNRAIFSGNHIYILGKSGPPEDKLGVQRRHLNGTIDRDFGERGTVILRQQGVFNHHVSDLVELPDGKVLITGSGNEAAIARLNPTGEPDPDFGNEGYMQFRAAGRSVGRFVKWKGSQIVLAGIEYDGRSTHNCFVAKLRDDGNPVTEFGIDGAISVISGRQDEFLDAYIDNQAITLFFQHDREAGIRHRVGLARIHLAELVGGA